MPNSPDLNARWTDAELAAAVAAYAAMRAAESSGQPYSKAQIRREALAGALAGRTAASFEYRMRNISAVLKASGQSWVKGYAPASNVGDETSNRIKALMSESSIAVARPPMVFFNVGWMKHYAGEDDVDPTIGRNFRGLKGLTHGGEAFNFRTRNGRVFGYRPGEQHELKLERLGAQADAAELAGVLVVWMAREPISGTTRIVGWYQNATALRLARQPQGALGNTNQAGGIPYTVWASSHEALLLPVEHRSFIVPSVRTWPGGFGMSPTWYGGAGDEMRDRVWRYVQSVEARRQVSPGALRSKGKGGSPRNSEHELRLKVEKIAVQHAFDHFESPLGGAYALKSVELERKGWDLEHAGGDGRRLLVEVKGLSGTDVRCELTPNEFAKMNEPVNRGDYVVYVVTQCLTETPLPHLFRFDSRADCWVAADGRTLTVEPRVGAICSA
jgi:hypothetical protein